MTAQPYLSPQMSSAAQTVPGGDPAAGRNQRTDDCFDDLSRAADASRSLIISYCIHCVSKKRPTL